MVGVFFYCDKVAFYLTNLDVHDGVQVDMLPVKAFQYQHGRYTLLSWYIRQRQTSQSHDMQLSVRSGESHVATDVYCEDPHDGQRRQAYLELSCYVSLDSEASVTYTLDCT